MSDARAALGSDRLPWLTDELAKPMATERSAPARANIWLSAIAGLLVVAGGSYWLGSRSGVERSTDRAPVAAVAERPSPAPATVPQPQVQIAPQPQVIEEPQADVRPVPQRELTIERSRPVRRVVDRPARRAAQSEPAPAQDQATLEQPAARPAAKVAAPAAPAVERPLKLWPAWQSQGADGRIVRIGAFGTRLQAKLGWRYMVQAYPAVAHLQATVVETRNSHGRHFYRFQLGTTSQAHSEVLCQRMQRIRFSCAVVGLPWKPKGVER